MRTGEIDGAVHDTTGVKLPWEAILQIHAEEFNIVNHTSFMVAVPFESMSIQRGPMNPADRASAEILRASIAHERREADRLSRLIESSPVPEVMNWAKLDLERLNKRIQANCDELEKLEFRKRLGF